VNLSPTLPPSLAYTLLLPWALVTKYLACLHFRNGSIRASLTQMEISAPGKEGGRAGGRAGRRKGREVKRRARGCQTPTRRSSFPHNGYYAGSGMGIRTSAHSRRFRASAHSRRFEPLHAHEGRNQAQPSYSLLQFDGSVQVHSPRGSVGNSKCRFKFKLTPEKTPETRFLLPLATLGDRT
jgi:hypothetical protein